MKKIIALATALVLSVGAASAATIQLGTFTAPIPSTGGVCTFATGLVTPIAPNTTICTLTVQPSGWQGAISNPAGGADSNKFTVTAVGGNSVVQNVVQLTATGSAAGNNQYDMGSVTTTP